MPKSFEKVKKKIGKKKGGVPTSLHENSRDSMSLRRAAMRDDKLQKVASSRRKNDQSFVTRTAYFQDHIRNNNSQPLEIPAIQELINTFVHQNDQEYEEVKKERRPGRPASTKEDLLRMKIAADEKEYQNGFMLPDLTDADNVTYLDRWDGAWSYLTTLKWVRISKEGNVLKTSFPPKGNV